MKRRGDKAAECESERRASVIIVEMIVEIIVDSV